MAEALIKYETIDDIQIAEIMQGRQAPPPADWVEDDASLKQKENKKKKSNEVNEQLNSKLDGLLGPQGDAVE
jgi:hypothetical protein